MHISTGCSADMALFRVSYPQISTINRLIIYEYGLSMHALSISRAVSEPEMASSSAQVSPELSDDTRVAVYVQLVAESTGMMLRGKEANNSASTEFWVL